MIKPHVILALLLTLLSGALSNQAPLDIEDTPEPGTGSPSLTQVRTLTQVVLDDVTETIVPPTPPPQPPVEVTETITIRPPLDTPPYTATPVVGVMTATVVVDVPSSNSSVTEVVPTESGLEELLSDLLSDPTLTSKAKSILSTVGGGNATEEELLSAFRLALRDDELSDAHRTLLQDALNAAASTPAPTDSDSDSDSLPAWLMIAIIVGVLVLCVLCCIVYKLTTTTKSQVVSKDPFEEISLPGGHHTRNGSGGDLTYELSDESLGRGSRAYVPPDVHTPTSVNHPVNYHRKHSNERRGGYPSHGYGYGQYSEKDLANSYAIGPLISARPPHYSEHDPLVAGPLDSARGRGDFRHFRRQSSSISNLQSLPPTPQLTSFHNQHFTGTPASLSYNSRISGNQPPIYYDEVQL